MDFEAVYKGLHDYCLRRKTEANLDGFEYWCGDCPARNSGFVKANGGYDYEVGSAPCGFEILPADWIL